ncbi:unnamed protein product, partial [Closterium sp. NIES-53]
RVLLHVAARRDYELHSFDFSTAFLQGRLHEEIWLRRPPGFTGTFPTETQWSLRQPVYGLRQSPREWHDTLRSTLRDLGFRPSSADLSLFVSAGSTPFLILIYVDDLVFATPDRAALVEVKSKLQKRHTCTDLGELQRYLDLQITRHRAARTITLTQSHMVQQVLQRFRLQFSTRQPTPLAVDYRLNGPFPNKPFEPSGPNPELVGCLMYLMTCTRPNLAYPLSVLSRFVGPRRHRPVQWTAAVRVAKYLATTSGMGLVLGGTQPVELTALCDFLYADNVETQRSTRGYCLSLRVGAVSWRSTRSLSVASSSAEAEIYAGAMAAQELRWLTFLLVDLGERPHIAPTLFANNKAMILLCHEPRLETRVKHIDVRYFLLRELQRRGQVRLDFVASEADTADLFTKALAPATIFTMVDPVANEGVADTLEARLAVARKHHADGEYRTIPLLIVELGIRSQWATEHPSRPVSPRPARVQRSTAVAGSSRANVDGQHCSPLRSGGGLSATTHVMAGGIAPTYGYFKFSSDRITVAPLQGRRDLITWRESIEPQLEVAGLKSFADDTVPIPPVDNVELRRELRAAHLLTFMVISRCWICHDPDHLSYECPDRDDSDEDDTKGGRSRSTSHRLHRDAKPRKEKQTSKKTSSLQDVDNSSGKSRGDGEASCSMVGVVESTVSLAPEASEDFHAVAAVVQANPMAVLLDSGWSHHLMRTKAVFVDMAPSDDLKGSGVQLQGDGDEMLLVAATGEMLGRARNNGRVLCTDLCPCSTRSSSTKVVALRTIISTTKSTPDWLHARLAHVGVDMIKSSAKHDVATGLNIKPSTGADPPCVSCVGGKLARHTFPENGSDAEEALAVVHIDLCGPFRVAAKDGSLYFLLLKDRHTRFVWVMPVTKKSDVLREFQKWLQNGMAEWEMRTAVESVRTMLLHMGVQHHWWHLALRQAVWDEERPELDPNVHADPEHRWDIAMVTVKEAMASWKGEAVKAAMEEEIRSLIGMGTWELVERPRGVNIMKNQWVLTTKYRIDDTVEREKARLSNIIYVVLV